MIVLDSYGVLAFLRDEPAAARVQHLLDGEAQLTSVGLAEVLDRLVRLTGVPDEEAALDLAELQLLDAIPLDPDTALRAGLLRARHYHRRTRAVSLADCVAAETTRALSAAIATSDPHLLDLCRDEGIERIVLPDSSGVEWSTVVTDR